MLNSLPLMFVDVDVVQLQVVPQDVGIDVEDVHILIFDVRWQSHSAP